jgi:hypothetical protein
MAKLIEAIEKRRASLPAMLDNAPAFSHYNCKA